MEVLFTIFPILIFAIWIFAFVEIIKAKNPSFLRRGPVSSDGHRVPKEQDLTCDRYGHDHEENSEFGRRYIVHEDPEDGYVILNGVKRKISDCKYL
ncbi:MAG: hypothetical protein IIZ33_02080 [Erysipelotrichaceae bacterium]|nr:hypothetical protein [Erysipelotrichaceae bacterium]